MVIIPLILCGAILAGKAHGQAEVTQELVAKDRQALTQLNLIRHIALIGKGELSAKMQPKVREVTQLIGLTYHAPEALAFASALNGKPMDDSRIKIDGDGGLLLLSDDEDELEATFVQGGKSISLGDWPLSKEARQNPLALQKVLRQGLGYDGVVISHQGTMLLIALVSPLPKDGSQAIVLSGTHDLMIVSDKSPKGKAILFVSDAYEGFAQAEVVLVDPINPKIDIGSKILFK